jgi:hypothetical protein
VKDARDEVYRLTGSMFDLCCLFLKIILHAAKHEFSTEDILVCDSVPQLSTKLDSNICIEEVCTPTAISLLMTLVVKFYSSIQVSEQHLLPIIDDTKLDCPEIKNRQ